MEYREAVAEGQRLVRAEGEIRFALGDLALTVAPVGDKHLHNGTWEGLQRFAEDIGIEFETLRQYRHVAQVWPDGVRTPSASWSAHKECMAKPEVLKRLAQHHDRVLIHHVREALGKRPARGFEETARGARDLPAEQKAEIVREALEDEEVRRDILSHTPTRAKLARTETQINLEQQDTAEERYELNNPRSVQIASMAHLEYATTKARRAFEDIREYAEKLTAYNWPDNNRERSEHLVLVAMAAGELALAAIRGQDLDNELKALVEGTK